MIALRKKLSRWIDGDLSEGELRSLEKTLREDGEARSCYFEYMANHAALCNHATGKEHAEVITSLQGSKFSDNLSSVGLEPPNLEHSADSSANRGQLFEENVKPRSLSWLAIAVGLLLVTCGLGGVSVLVSDSMADRLAANDQLNHLNHGSILQSIEPKSDECRWYVEEVERDSAGSLSSGDVIRVTRGKLAMQYVNGTQVLLHSPAAFQVLSDMRARLIVGRLTATVPEEGIGFSVITPQATVVDLGTEFGLEVDDDGATDVVVFKGEVDVDYHDKATDAQRLRMGEAVRLDAIGTASRIVSINGMTYSDQALQELDRPSVIAEVRDNIERDSPLMNFYQIVHGGMAEDTLSYVDRISHQYNGLTSAGMPNYLVNGDYVKMFNNDRMLDTFRIDVCINMPAKLYVLLDNRLEAPEWLKQDFRDTGDDIGLDGGPFQSVGPDWHNMGPSGVGPGNSIDDALSVWVREVKEPGVVHLGPLGVTPEFGANMYGLVATPLDASL